MKLAIASDHGGFDLKKEILSFLKQKNIEAADLGPENTVSVDYPDYAVKVAEAVSTGRADAGLLLCGTGVGMCIAANKFKNVRAAVVEDIFSAKMAKEHNNANILCLGGRVVDAKKAKELVAVWLDTKYEGGRHDRRLDKIREIEKKNFK
jgi:ribose 5-phosphate isomerase B